MKIELVWHKSTTALCPPNKMPSTDREAFPVTESHTMPGTLNQSCAAAPYVWAFPGEGPEFKDSWEDGQISHL